MWELYVPTPFIVLQSYAFDISLESAALKVAVFTPVGTSVGV